MSNLEPRKVEQVVKGFANHRRIQLLLLLKREPELSVNDISDKLIVNFRTASDHIRKMTNAGLIMKRHSGVEVLHALTDRGKKVLDFLSKLPQN